MERNKTQNTGGTLLRLQQEYIFYPFYRKKGESTIKMQAQIIILIKEIQQLYFLGDAEFSKDGCTHTSGSAQCSLENMTLAHWDIGSLFPHPKTKQTSNSSRNKSMT